MAALSPLEKAHAFSEKILKYAGNAHKFHVGLQDMEISNDMSKFMGLAAASLNQIYARVSAHLLKKAIFASSQCCKSSVCLPTGNLLLVYIAMPKMFVTNIFCWSAPFGLQTTKCGLEWPKMPEPGVTSTEQLGEWPA